MKKQTIVVIILLALAAVICDIGLVIHKINDNPAQDNASYIAAKTPTAAVTTATQTATHTETQPQPTVSDPTLTLAPENSKTPILSSTRSPITTTSPAPTNTYVPTFTPTPTEKWTPYPTMAPTPQQTAKPTAEPPKELENIDFSKKTITISSMNSKYKTQGRCPIKTFSHPNTGKSENAVLLNYPASAFTFRAYCEGTVTIELYTPNHWSSDSIYINVVVDGVKISTRSNYKISGRKLHTITLGTGLEKGVHTFTIERQSEVSLGSLYVNSVTLNGEIASAPQNADYFIEFIGDSLIAGYGILYPNASEGEYSSNQSSSAYQDATKAFAYLTAKKLNADYSIVAETGIGILSGYTSRIMSNIYSKVCPSCYDESAWSFGRRADAVVITLGTNDNAMVSKGKITYAQMKAGFKDFVLQVRAKNPSAKIVWAYGAMGYGAKTCINEVLKELGGEANGYYYVGLAYNGDAGVGHPSISANAQNAETLTQALKKILCG